MFNTALSGYQEVLSDPSYAGQIVTFTNPHIGNYGVNAADFESPPGVGGAHKNVCSAAASSSATSPAATPTVAPRTTSTRCCAPTASPASPASTRGGSPA